MEIIIRTERTIMTYYYYRYNLLDNTTYAGPAADGRTETTGIF